MHASARRIAGMLVSEPAARRTTATPKGRQVSGLIAAGQSPQAGLLSECMRHGLRGGRMRTRADVDAGHSDLGLPEPEGDDYIGRTNVQTQQPMGSL